MVIVLGSFDIHTADRARVSEYAGAMAAKTNQETGCLSYHFSWDLSNPNRLLLQERWKSLEALNSHFQTEHIGQFRKQLQSIQMDNANAMRYTIIEMVALPVGSSANN